MFSVAPPPPSAVSNRLISPPMISHPYASSDFSPIARNPHNKSPNLLLRMIRSAAALDSVIEDPTPAAKSKEEEEEIPVKIGAKVRVKVPLKVYHIPKVPEVELNGKEGKIKEYVAVWKGKKNISANFPYKIEFLEKLEGRGDDKPVKFFAHLKEDEFDFID